MPAIPLQPSYPQPDDKSIRTNDPVQSAAALSWQITAKCSLDLASEKQQGGP